MCDFDKNFILCTCVPDNEPLEKPYWTLSKDNSGAISPDNRPEFDLDNEIMGVFDPNLPAFVTTEEQSIAQAVLLELNERNCFDFRYKPSPDDLLTLVYPQRTLEFVYTSHGDSYIRGYKQRGSWVQKLYPSDESFELVEGRISTIPPEVQIRKPR